VQSELAAKSSACSDLEEMVEKLQAYCTEYEETKRVWSANLLASSHRVEEADVDKMALTKEVEALKERFLREAEANQARMLVQAVGLGDAHELEMEAVRDEASEIKSQYKREISKMKRVLEDTKKKVIREVPIHSQP